jgi:hypothetical protein
MIDDLANFKSATEGIRVLVLDRGTALVSPLRLYYGCHRTLAYVSDLYWHLYNFLEDTLIVGDTD